MHPDWCYMRWNASAEKLRRVGLLLKFDAESIGCIAIAINSIDDRILAVAEARFGCCCRNSG